MKTYKEITIFSEVPKRKMLEIERNLVRSHLNKSFADPGMREFSIELL